MISASKLRCYTLPIAPPTLTHYCRTLGLTGGGAALMALARAVAASSAWDDTAPGAVLLVRPAPSPLLAVMGRFDAAQEAWLGAQARTLDAACARLRLVSYQRAEEACESLASMLVDRLGRRELGSARFVAIPRGGFVVLGLLAAILGLERDQLEPPHAPEPPLVVVDDCAFTGSRFRSCLARHEHHETIVFAHLYSHPELRASIEAREGRVVACLGARDLGLGDVPDPDAERRARFLAQLDDAYWIGETEALAFPWTEPDRMIWHPAARRPVLAWRVVPPELCLKNRARQPLPIQVQPAAEGPLGPGREVIFGELEGAVVLHHLGRGESAVLDAVASDIWRAVVRHGDLPPATAELIREYAAPEEELRREAADFVERLLEQGFLERKEALSARPAAGAGA